MKKFVFCLFIALCATVSAFAQTPTVGETTIVFNSTTQRYEVWARFNQDGPVSIGTSVISVILPASATNTALTVFPVNGGGWSNTSNSYDQESATKDYHGVITSGQSNMAYGTANTEILLFEFEIPGGGCLPGIRLWTSGTDLDQTPDGTEYISNIYTPANANYILTSNYGTASPSCCTGASTCHDTVVQKN